MLLLLIMTVISFCLIHLQQLLGNISRTLRADTGHYNTTLSVAFEENKVNYVRFILDYHRKSHS